MRKSEQTELRNLLSRAKAATHNALLNYTPYRPTLDHEAALKSIAEASEALSQAAFAISNYLCSRPAPAAQSPTSNEQSS